MKRNIIFLMLLLVIGSSCNKALDTIPTGALSPLTSYSSNTQIRSAIAGLYYPLRTASMYSKVYSTQLAVGTDETYYYNTNYQYNTYAYILGASDGDITNFWSNCYQGVNYCNTMIDNIDASAATGTADAATVRKAKGEAYFLRGYYYFLLVQWFGDVPLQLHASTDPSQGQIARIPSKQVYDQIIADMTKADGLLFDQTFSSLGYSDEISVTGVEGMLARVCLYAAGNPVNEVARYADARTWALKVINSNQHSLQSTYQKVFTDEITNVYNNENIWEIGYNNLAVGSNSASGQFSVFMGIGKSTGTVISGITYFDSYDYSYVKPYPRLYVSYQPGDLRRDWNISNFGYSGLNKQFYSATQIWTRQIGKWRRELEPDVSRTNQTNSSTNFPVLRYSDVLLMYAEAENEVNGPTSAAYNAINQVRRRAFSTTPIVNTITVNTTGSGYNASPAITFNNSLGSGAVAFGNLTGSTVTGITVTSSGSGYTTAPTVIVGTPWAASTAYVLNSQVINNGLVYTITKAGTSTLTPPTNTSGASNPATTGATFTYAGIAATATVNITSLTGIDIPPSLSKDDFRAAIQKERYLELCFESLRKPDLKRWGLFIPTVQSMAIDVNTGATNPAWSMPIPRLLSELTSTGADLPANTGPANIGSKDIYLPIPQHDLLLNYLLKQNPGY